MLYRRDEWVDGSIPTGASSVVTSVRAFSGMIIASNHFRTATVTPGVSPADKSNFRSRRGSGSKTVMLISNESARTNSAVRLLLTA